MLQCKRPTFKLQDLGRFLVTVITEINKSMVYFIVRHNEKFWCSGPCCLKLTMSLVNILLKFKMLKSEIYFWLKKCEKLFLTKNFSVFGYKVVKHLKS